MAMKKGPLMRAVFLAALGVACGGSDDKTGTNVSEQVCVPGKSDPCTGPGGCSGGQVCNAEGTGFGECVCSPQDAAIPIDTYVPVMAKDVCREATYSNQACIDLGRVRTFYECTAAPTGCDFAAQAGVYCCD